MWHGAGYRGKRGAGSSTGFYDLGSLTILPPVLRGPNGQRLCYFLSLPLAFPALSAPAQRSSLVTSLYLALLSCGRGLQGL